MRENYTQTTSKHNNNVVKELLSFKPDCFQVFCQSLQKEKPTGERENVNQSGKHSENEGEKGNKNWRKRWKKTFLKSRNSFWKIKPRKFVWFLELWESEIFKERMKKKSEKYWKKNVFKCFWTFQTRKISFDFFEWFFQNEIFFKNKKFACRDQDSNLGCCGHNAEY